MNTPLTQIEGVGPAMANALASNGYAFAEDVAGCDLESLCTVPGIGAVRGEKLLAAAKSLVAHEKPVDKMKPAKDKKAKASKGKKKSGKKSEAKGEKKGKGKGKKKSKTKKSKKKGKKKKG